jgi:hypothetical protein
MVAGVLVSKAEVITRSGKHDNLTSCHLSTYIMVNLYELCDLRRFDGYQISI